MAILEKIDNIDLLVCLHDKERVGAAFMSKKGLFIFCLIKSKPGWNTVSVFLQKLFLQIALAIQIQLL